MCHEAEVLVALFVIFVAARVGAEIAQRLKMPGVVGEIAAGCLIGPSVLNWIQITSRLEVIAEIGAWSMGARSALTVLFKRGAHAKSSG